MKAIHPGEHLAEELKEMGMSAAELSRQLRVPTNRVTQILNGRRYRRHRFKAGALFRY
jgi:antitoxin HigA-1